MKELKEFTEELLKFMIESDHAQTGDVAALAKIALAAKRNEPIGEVRLSDYDSGGWRQGHVICLHDQADWDNFPDGTKLYTTPPLSKPCIKCNDTGIADSGGTQPWGEPISVECDCTNPRLNHAKNRLDMVVPNGWVKCSERMPLEPPSEGDEDYKQVEVLVTDGLMVATMECCSACPKCDSGFAPWVEFTSYGPIPPKDVTHWMPLPATPKPEM